MPDPLGRQMTDTMRAWVQNLDAGNRKRLNQSQKIVFSWEALKATYPKQAVAIDDYVEQLRIGFVDYMNQHSKPIPDRIAKHHLSDTVEIKKSARGECWIVIYSKAGMRQCYLEIAAPQ